MRTSVSSCVKTHKSVFILTDEQVAKNCLPVLHSSLPADAPTLVLPAGEEHKNLDSVQRIWNFLIEHHATRSSLLVNLGGGVICDMGGFAAATYMRGMAFVNVPTTLLAMVDAAAGGKTGIDYHSLKNTIGVFAEPVETVIVPQLLRTLPPEQLLSGFAEMLKHGILESPEAFGRLLEADLRDAGSKAFGELIRHSAAFKQAVVSQDPHDKGLRQQLNFGHTVGHAIEALCLAKHNQKGNSKCLHGYCVLYGMVAEAYLSHIQCGLPAEVVSTLSRFMQENYGSAPVTCNDYEALLQLMQHDKKNKEPGQITCTLLQAIGMPVIGQIVSPEHLREALEYLCSI